MADLRVENPRTTEQFVEALKREGVVLPLQPGEDGTILDATGRDILVVDVNRERPDDQVANIVLWLVLAANTCGGFVAVARTH